MNRSVICHLLISLCLISSLIGCAAPPTEIPTLGQKLGIPQAIFRCKDNRLNRRGNRPWKERKPKLLKLADPKNLAPEMPEAVKVAAAIKQAEDLAPQKIKALQYIGLIGCDCYDANKEMEKALAESLKDCTPCVRLAAINAIGMSVDACNKRAMRFNKKRENCGGRPERECLCKKRGCRGCNQCSTEEVVVENSACGYCLGQGCGYCQSKVVECGGCDTGCSSCGGCYPNSCCSKDLRKILDDIANGKDDNGCWLEPLENIRTAAAGVLAMCPPLPWTPEEPEEPEVETEGEESDTEGEESDEENGGPEEDTDGDSEESADEEGEAESDDVETVSASNSSLLRMINSGYKSKSAKPKPRSKTTTRSKPKMNPNMMVARVQSIENGLLYISFEKNYKLPENSKVVVVAENGFEQVMQILTSTIGQVIVHPTDQSNTRTPWQTNAKVFVGLLAN